MKYTFWLVLWLAVSFIYAEDRVWISVDRKEALEIQAAMAEKYGIELRWYAFLDQQLAIGQIASEDIDALSQHMHEVYLRCGGFVQHPSFEDAQLVGEKLRQQAAKAMTLGSPFTRDNPQGAQLLAGAVTAGNILDFITTFSSYDDRYYTSQTGIDAAEWLQQHWQQLTEGRDNVEVSLVRHSDFPQPSVRARFIGTSEPDQVVVLGGHLDSITRDTLAPGADDNASGIGCVTELIRVLADTEYRPAKTIDFFGYAGEERGLLGSRDIAGDYAQEGTNVVAVMQLDMTNFNGSAEDIWFLSDYTDTTLTGFVEGLVDHYLPELTRSQTACGYGCSDHAAWYWEGYRTVMPFEARFGDHNRSIHTDDDTLARSNNTADHAAKFARIAAVYLAEVAKGGVFEPIPERAVTVDMRTLVELANTYGACSGLNCATDLVKDGQVNNQDLLYLMQDWRKRTCLGFGNGAFCLEP